MITTTIMITTITTINQGQTTFSVLRSMIVSAISVAVFLPTSAHSIEEHPPPECKREAFVKCQFVTFGTGTKFFEAPSRNSKVVLEARPAEVFLGDPKALLVRRTGWVKVFLPVQFPGEWRTQIAWVPREEVLARSDFTKASGCWPVSFMKVELGEYWADIAFSASGRADVSGAQNAKAHVYFAENVFELRPTQRGRDGILRGAMDSHTGSLDIRSVEGLVSHRTRARESLGNCSRFPSASPVNR
jgi:hypothetical protein